MLEIIVDNRVIYVVTGGVTAFGVVSKIISNVSLKRMVKAAGNMSKSNHALMRLVRAKFEHACMVSEKVENVPVFVDKYLYEYKTMGLKLHTWRRIQTLCVALCLTLGALGAFLEYSVNGMNDEVIRVGAYGGILGVLLYLFHLTTDENYRLEAAKNYMVDYLENVCLHKYEKAYQKGETKEIPSPRKTPEVEAPAKPEPYEVQDFTPQIKAYVPEERKPQREMTPEEIFQKEMQQKEIQQKEMQQKEMQQKEMQQREISQKEELQKAARETLKEAYKKEEKKPDKDVLIRQILEEFMA